MKNKSTIIMFSVTGGLFVILLAAVFAYQWPGLHKKFSIPSTPVTQREVDTNDWLTYKDPDERFELLYPTFFHDLAPLGYNATRNYHSFGPSTIQSPGGTTLEELEIQGITLTVTFSLKEETPMSDPERIKNRHAWFEKDSLIDLSGNIYTYLAYGDITYEGENGYALAAIHELPNTNEVLIIQLFSFSKEDIITHRSEFESIVKHFRLL